MAGHYAGTCGNMVEAMGHFCAAMTVSGGHAAALAGSNLALSQLACPHPVSADPDSTSVAQPPSNTRCLGPATETLQRLGLYGEIEPMLPAQIRYAFNLDLVDGSRQQICNCFITSVGAHVGS